MAYVASWLMRDYAAAPLIYVRRATKDVPKLLNPKRDFRAVGDASWLAVPFLPRSNVIAIHQVRNLLSAIRSFYSIGFFDSHLYERHRRFVDIADFRIALAPYPEFVELEEMADRFAYAH